MTACACATRGEKNGYTLFESGHYYSSHGPTLWSRTGWEITTQMKKPGDHTTIMVDDVHPKSLLSSQETNLPVVEFEPDPCFTILESEMEKPGLEVLEMLQNLRRKDGNKVGRRHRAIYRPGKGHWICSGFPLTAKSKSKNDPQEPLCLLYDLGLTWHKYQLGFRRLVNVLPEFYFSEQYGLIKIARKIMPDLDLSTVLYDINGGWRLLRREDTCPNGD